jgi:predicted methyltransferase
MVLRSLPPLLTADIAKAILGGARRVSLDLGLSERVVSVEGELASLDGGFAVSLSDLKKISRHENAIYFPDDGSIYQIAVSDVRFYKLVPTAGAPTIEIDGVRMHRTKGTTPNEDAEEKLETLGLRGGRVLDTCMGLGYTAAGALRRDAEAVVTIEREPAVVRIAEMNPWSSALFDGDVSQILGDSFFVIDSLSSGLFDWVIHDPPRFSHAGTLYSEEFYRKLYRVMTPGARLFHYTGEPGSRYRGVNLQKGVQRRLRSTGFESISYHPGVMGVTCER